MEEALLAYVELLRKEALDAYRQKLNWYVNGKIAKEPSLPGLLRDV